MWIQISFWYGLILIGVYSLVLPQSDALVQKMPHRSSKELKILAHEISNNKEYTNREFKELLKPWLIPRMPGTDNNLRVQQYIKDHFNKLNWHIEEDSFEANTPYGIKPFTNIIATFEPDVKNKMVLSCHFDSKNMSDSRGNYLVAATDSAVPCAILMDLAKKLDCGMRRKQVNRKRSLHDDVTVQMMFFDGEEAYHEWTETDSLYGSRHLARWLKETPDPFYPETSRLDNIDIFVLLDLIGSDDIVFKNFFSSTTAHFKQLQKIESGLRKAGLFNPKSENKVLFSNQRPWGYIEDDHKPFMRERPGIPVLHLISSPFPRVWHTMADNENAINYDVTDNFIRIFRVFVASYIDIPAVSCKK